MRSVDRKRLREDTKKPDNMPFMKLSDNGVSLFNPTGISGTEKEQEITKRGFDKKQSNICKITNGKLIISL